MPDPFDVNWSRDIHQRLLAEDPVAPAELARNVLGPLAKEIGHRFPRYGDDPLLRDAVTDAVMDYIKNPGRFDPSRKSLWGYLVMVADGDMKNALKKAGRKRKDEIVVGSVEDESADGNTEVKAVQAGRQPDQIDSIREKELVAKIREALPDARDRQVLDLILAGERSTERFAEVLGLEGLSVEEQRRAVKRHKDRITKRLHRMGEEIHDEEY